MSTWADFRIELPSGASGEVDTPCPECSHKRRKRNAKCLSINVEKGVWECKHCGWSGGLGIGQGTASGDPFAEYGAPLRPKEWAKPRPVPATTPTLWERAAAWFANERGIPEAVLRRNRIAVASEWCPVCEEATSHVLFPVYRGGEHVNTKHRCSRKHFRMEKGAERVPYGLDDAAGAALWIWVEGEIDKLSLEVAGFVNVVSVPDGAPPPDAKNYAGKFAFLEAAEAEIAATATHVIAVDADPPGQALADELCRRLGRERCRLVVWPDGIKDANEALVKVGPDFLRACIDAAEPVKIDGIFTLADIDAEIDHLYAHGYDRGVACGWPMFDRHYRVRPGLMTVVTGIPGHGKSSFLDAVLVRLAVLHGWTFAVCSPENQPLARHAAGILAKYLGKPFHDGPTPRITPEELAFGKRWMAERFAFVLPDEPTVEAILDRAKALVFRMGVKGVVIDPWNEIEHSRPEWQHETEYVSQCLGKLRRFARINDVHLWIVAHPTKLRRNDDGTEPVPGLWDVSGSANFRNKADAGLTVWRDVNAPDEPVQVHVTKVRFAETGELGRVDFRFDRATGTYREA